MRLHICRDFLFVAMITLLAGYANPSIRRDPVAPQDSKQEEKRADKNKEPSEGAASRTDRLLSSVFMLNSY